MFETPPRLFSWLHASIQSVHKKVGCLDAWQSFPAHSLWVWQRWWCASHTQTTDSEDGVPATCDARSSWFLGQWTEWMMIYFSGQPRFWGRPENECKVISDSVYSDFTKQHPQKANKMCFFSMHPSTHKEGQTYQMMIAWPLHSVVDHGHVSWCSYPSPCRMAWRLYPEVDHDHISR